MKSGYHVTDSAVSEQVWILTKWQWKCDYINGDMLVCGAQSCEYVQQDTENPMAPQESFCHTHGPIEELKARLEGRGS
jgi:hypothetical protein